jgi:flavorubredoxin
VEYALASKDSLKQIILFHGEPDKAQALMDKLAEYPEMPVPVCAEKGQEFDL